jgi:hypothetical protein
MEQKRDTTRRSFMALGVAVMVVRGQGVMASELSESGMKPVDHFDWEYLADTVMGGVSTGQARIRTTGDGSVLSLTGTVSTENRGGFIQARAKLSSGLPEGTQGVALRARGNGERYFVHLRTSATRLPWQYYQAGFEAGAKWRDIAVRLDAFEPSGRSLPGQIDPRRVRSVAVVAYGRDHQADLSVNAIGTF